MDQNELVAPDLKRRKFLMAARGAGTLGAIAALVGRSTSAEAAAVAPAPTDPPAQRGYHETEHIRNYYRTARYW
jgi:hypothetical protein